MADKPSTLESRAGCWDPIIVFIEILCTLPVVFWLLDKERYPWNVLVLALILLLALLYFVQHRKSAKPR